MKAKYMLAAGLFCGMMFSSCYEDKGNYAYSDVEQIEITLPEGLSVMANSEYIVFDPVVTSSFVGTVDGQNDNYEFNCKINYRHTDPDTGESLFWLDINPEKKKDINFIAGIPAGNYPIWYSVTNKETGFTANAKGMVSVLTSTFEGWMVLSNEGADKKARVDMISKNSKGEPMVAANLLGADAPDIKNATQLALYASMYAGREAIYLLSESGGYRLDIDKLTTTESNNIK